MVQISDRQRGVAAHLALVLSIEKPPVFRFHDDQSRSQIHVITAVDRPQPGVNTYGTVGLSDYPLMRNGEEFPARVEFVGACGSAFPGLDNVISTLAFCVINSGWFCAPGVIFPGAVAMHEASTTLSDIFFSHPFLWDEALGSKEIAGRTVAWLLAVPISKAETEFAIEHGPAALENLFVERQIDVYNLNRKSEV